MSYAYKYTPASTMIIRTEHARVGDLGRLPGGTLGYGNELWNAPADGVDVKAGDQWIHILEIDSQLVDGWVAVIYMGTAYGTVQSLSVPPAPSAGVAVDSVEFVEVDGKITKTVRYTVNGEAKILTETYLRQGV